MTLCSFETSSGPLTPEITRTLPDTEIIDRLHINAWRNGTLRAAVEAIGRRPLLMAGLWTEVRLTFPALSATQAGYEVFAVVDASAGSSTAAHEAAIVRRCHGHRPRPHGRLGTGRQSCECGIQQQGA
ncbi:hypothetical protein AQJ27_45410 [Streptomyces olivochromogenes]|uniref:Hydrolase n=2 Tax=Streptomyces olivochromogenes TaxID=1963 RepID=A0A250VT76_STROL|nr:hypothetical protein AQJ27_45410 [Streptomyces olivochromogenes]GAX57407.1 hydrolase [Streptomyces olivochromogenes]